VHVVGTAASAAGEITVADGGGGGGAGSWLLPLLIILVGVYFFTIQRRRSRAAQQEQSNLGPGSLIMTRGGLYGTVVEVDGQDVLLEIAPDIVCRFSKGAIGRIVSSPTSGVDEDTAETLDGETPDGDAAVDTTPVTSATGEVVEPAGEDGTAPSATPAEGDKLRKKEL